MSERTLIGDALAAFDQSLTVAGEGTAFDRDYWLQRAAVAATIAAAQQARVGNLVAWKQLRQAAPTSALPGSGDAITAEIEAALGITDPVPDAGVDAVAVLARIRQEVDRLDMGGADEGEYGDGQTAFARTVLEIIEDGTR